MPHLIETLFGETRVRLLRLLRRPRQTITALAQALGLTDNAVRTHVAALGRDGIVAPTGTVRDTGGKPARTYGLTREGEELFPKAYAAVLDGLVEEIAAREGRDRATELLRAVGDRLAAGVNRPSEPGARVQAAANALRAIGGDLDVLETETGWRLQGHGCPLSRATAEHEEVCAVATAIVARITGLEVTECCDRADRPRCAFEVERLPAMEST